MRTTQAYIFLLLGFLFLGNQLFAQVDSVKTRLPALDVPALKPIFVERPELPSDTLSTDVAPKIVYKKIDSATLARMLWVTDSIQKIVLYLPKTPYPITSIIDSVEKMYLVRGQLNLLTYLKKQEKVKVKDTYYKIGKAKPRGVLWLPLSVIGLLLYFAILRQYYGKQMQTFLQAFYSNRWLNAISKEDSLLNSWLFLLMYLFFGLTMGSFLCLTSRYFKLQYPIDGLLLWGVLSGLIILILSFKILILRMIGFIFDVKKLISEYVSILYLAYFNTSMILLPLLLFFCFSPLSYGKYYVYLGASIIVFVLLIQVLRAGINILSHFKLGKFYLLLYICALEICPILIIIKALAY